MMLRATRICTCGEGLWQDLRLTLRSSTALSAKTAVKLPMVRAASSETRKENLKDKDDVPVQYSTSKAFLHKVLDFSGEEKKPKYQRAIISTSLVIFMLYFFVFREENDLDREMKKPLWEKVPGLERQTLQALIEYNKKNGKDNTATEARMVQLLAEEAAGLGPSLRKPAAVRPVLVVAGKPIA